MLVHKNFWHIGFAADTPNGLMVPVIRDADKKSVPEIAKEMNELAKLAREGKIKPDQMQGGTFSISSLGGIAIAVTERGFVEVDRQMRTNVAHIFAIRDAFGEPMLAHKAVHEGHVAAEVAHGAKSHFDARQIPSVAYTDPEVAWAGKTEDQCKAEGINFGKAVFPWAASGRAIANGRDEGFTKLLFDTATHGVIGGGIVGTHASDLISEICLAIEMGCEPADIGKTIHPHPTLGESIGMAAEVFEGHCTDLPPQKKK